MLRTGKASAIVAVTVQLSRRSAGCACETGRPRWQNQIGLTPRRQAAGRSAERAHVAIASQPTPYALPSWSQKFWLPAGATRPPEFLQPQRKTKSPARRGWHEGTADATLLTSLRGWASALLPGQSHNTHCPFGRAKTSHLNSFRADNSPRAGPFCAELRSDNVALCAIPPLHCHADC